MASRMFGFLACAAVAFAIGGCGPLIPVSPTWQNDIRPLMVARCIRCHDNPGHTDPQADTKAWPLLLGPGSPNFNYATFGDIPASVVASMQKSGQRARGSVGPLFARMPPPPAEALEAWQIEMLDAWAFAPR